MAVRRAQGETAIGIGLLLVAALVFWETANAPASPLYARVGPTAFPYAVGACLLLFGALLTWQGLQGGWREAEAEAEAGPVRKQALFWLIAGLAINAGLIKFTGFVIASALLFICTARAFGSRRPLKDGAIGLALALVAYLGFAKLLGISLGRGLIEGFL